MTVIKFLMPGPSESSSLRGSKLPGFPGNIFDLSVNIGVFLWGPISYMYMVLTTILILTMIEVTWCEIGHMLISRLFDHFILLSYPSLQNPMFFCLSRPHCKYTYCEDTWDSLSWFGGANSARKSCTCSGKALQVSIIFCNHVKDKCSPCRARREWVLEQGQAWRYELFCRQPSFLWRRQFRLFKLQTVFPHRSYKTSVFTAQDFASLLIESSSSCVSVKTVLNTHLLWLILIVLDLSWLTPLSTFLINLSFDFCYLSTTIPLTCWFSTHNLN